MNLDILTRILRIVKWFVKNKKI